MKEISIHIPRILIISPGKYIVDLYIPAKEYEDNQLQLILKLPSQ